MPSQLDVDKIRHTNGTDALTFDTSGNTNLQKDLKFGSTAAIKNSAGNNILSESGGNVTLENVRLPASGGISDSSGNALLTASAGAVSLGSTVVPSSSMMFRNKLINGNFDIWQRGTSQTNDGYGSADRWQNSHSGSTKTASQQAFTLGQTDVPGNPKYYLRHVVSSVAGNVNYCLALQKFEGVETLAGQTATLSFWAKADSNKNIATEFFQYFGSGGSPSSQVETVGVTTYSLTTSWQKFTATVAIPSISGKTIGTDGRDCLGLIFWFDAGSNWNSRTNSLGQQSGTFDIAQVQVEEGPVATPFEHRPIGMELSLCQRYCQVIKGLGGSGASGEGLAVNGRMNGGGAGDCQYNFPHVMRASPTAEVDFDSAYFEYGSVVLTVSSITASALTQFGANLRANVSGGANGNACIFRLTGSTQINFAAEL
jgi:hypothetical protein